MSNWAREYFDRGYGQRWGLGAPGDHVRAEADGIWTLLALAHGARVADVGCGRGWHALALARRGALIVGAAASRPLLSRARELSRELGVPAHWVRADMRWLPFRSGAFDAALVMDAFGFFETEDQDAMVLQEVGRTLKPDGRLLMKVVNGELVLNDLHPANREERDGQVIEIARTLSGRVMTEHVRISGPRGGGEYRREQRLYRSNEVQRVFARAGLPVKSLSGSYDGSTFDAASSPAMWVVGERR